MLLALATENPVPSVQDSSVFEELLSHVDAFEALGTAMRIISQNNESFETPLNFSVETMDTI